MALKTKKFWYTVSNSQKQFTVELIEGTPNKIEVVRISSGHVIKTFSPITADWLDFGDPVLMEELDVLVEGTLTELVAALYLRGTIST